MVFKNTPRMYYAVGTDTSCMVKNNDSTFTAASGANTQATLEINMTQGTTYYIWSFVYNKPSAIYTIPSISFVETKE